MAALTFSEVVPLLVLFTILFGLAAALHKVRKASEPSTDIPELDTDFVQRETPAMRARRRRGGLARMRRAVDTQDDSSSDSSSPAEVVVRRSKKRDANREAKREAREAHLARLEAMREEQAKRDRLRAQEREREEEQARLDEAERRRVAEEKEEREMKEYETWKHLFSVEESGEGAELEKDDPHLLQRFCEYVKKHKMLVLEELAAEFGMRTDHVVDRLTRLEQTGEISGFFDDRGKFIYVSTTEMNNVANFINKKGRVSIHELASESTRLLSLEAASSSSLEESSSSFEEESSSSP